MGLTAPLVKNYLSMLDANPPLARFTAIIPSYSEQSCASSGQYPITHFQLLPHLLHQNCFYKQIIRRTRRQISITAQLYTFSYGSLSGKGVHTVAYFSLIIKTGSPLLPHGQIVVEQSAVPAATRVWLAWAFHPERPLPSARRHLLRARSSSTMH